MLIRKTERKKYLQPSPPLYPLGLTPYASTVSRRAVARLRANVMARVATWEAERKGVGGGGMILPDTKSSMCAACRLCLPALHASRGGGVDPPASGGSKTTPPDAPGDERR